MPDSNEPFFLFNPVDGDFRITSRFNTRRDYSPNKRHEGLDLAVKTATGGLRRILAGQRGTVSRIRHNTTGLGVYVKLDHVWSDGDEYSTWYGHLSSVNPDLKIGQFVQAGAFLGIGGTTGNSTGPHLHLTVQHHGHGLSGYVLPDVINPTNIIRMTADHGSIDQMVYVADVTAPDGMLIEAGKTFVKTWRVRNVGSTTWGDGYEMIHVDGDTMGARQTSFKIPAARPGEEVEISIPMKVPDKAGRIQSVWQPRNKQNRLFMFQMFVDVVSVKPIQRDGMNFVRDINVPDGTVVEEGSSFLKTWRIKNTGSTTWRDYTLEYVGDPFARDSQMGAPLAVNIPFARPNSEINVSVTLQAPASVGTHRSTWRLRKKDGGLFGEPLFVEIDVSRRVQPTTGRNGLGYIDDVTIQDNTELVPHQKIQKIWRIRNNGDTTWGDGYVLAHVGGDRMGAPPSVKLPQAGPGQIVHAIVDFTVPDKTGGIHSEWMAKDPNGNIFGENLTVVIKVVDIEGKDNYRFIADVTVPDNTVLQVGQRVKKIWRVRNTGTREWGRGYTLRHVDNKNLSAQPQIPLPVTKPGQSVDIALDITAPGVPGTHKTSWRPFNQNNQPFGFELFALIKVPTPATINRGRDEARLAEHTTYPNGSKVELGESFNKQWTITNSGQTTWGQGYTLAFSDGDQMSETESVAVRPTRTGQTLQIGVPLVAPSVPGEYTGHWRMRDPSGKMFGSKFMVRVIVEAAANAVDMLPYMRGDGRLYEMKHFFHNGQGQQRVQTQLDRNKFYHVKNSEWEELWSDNNFIYRGTDTSPGSGNFYRLSENGKHGSRWVPRKMKVGQIFRRRPLVTLQRKDNCQKLEQGSGFHDTYIQLEKVLDELVLPDVQNRDGRGLKVRNVIVFAGMHSAGDVAGAVFERYYYAQKYGLVMWEGLDTGHNGRSFMVEEHARGARPDNVRETLRCGPF